MKGQFLNEKGVNHPGMKLWYRGLDVLIKYKENKGSNHSHCRYCETVHQNIPLRCYGDRVKNDPEVVQKLEKVILLILEILKKYYSIEFREGIETFRTIFRMPHERRMFYFFSLDFCCCFGGISNQTEILIS